MKIAYLILAHHKKAVLDRLIRAIYSPDNIYMFHIDAKADNDLHSFVADLAAHNPNIKVLPARSATWSCWSLVQVELDGIKELLKEEWDNYILLSGQDFPTASQAEIKRTLLPYLGKNFIRVGTMPPDEIAFRFNSYHVEDCGKMKNFGPREPFESYFVDGFKPYMGVQWKILHRSFCEFAVNSQLAFDMQDYFRYTLTPDETYFATLLVNSQFEDTLMNNLMRHYVMYETLGFRRAADMTMEQLQQINFNDPSRPILFVRKVNESHPEVIEFLEKRVYQHEAI